MPLLIWSPSALAVLRNKGERDEMTRLFDAYFRVAGEKSIESLTGTILHLDLPEKSERQFVNPPPVGITAHPSLRPRPAVPVSQPDRNRYHFYAKFIKSIGWIVEAVLKEEFRTVWWGSRWPNDLRSPSTHRSR
jgi:hypothetical protein